jgi:hypothetical protein
MGKRRNVYVAVSGKYDGRRLLGRLGVADGMEINWFLKKWNGMKWDEWAG